MPTTGSNRRPPRSNPGVPEQKQPFPPFFPLWLPRIGAGGPLTRTPKALALAGVGVLFFFALPAGAQTPPPLPAASSPSLPKIVLNGGAVSGPLSRPRIDHLRASYGGEVTFDADLADADFRAQTYRLSGGVRLHETDTTLRAGAVTFGGKAQSASATDAILNQSVFTIRSPLLTATPEKIQAQDGDFTTVPPDVKPDYHVHAQSITLDRATHRGTLRNATLYLFGTRLLTVPRFTFHTGGGGGAARRHVMIPVFGVSARYGTYVAFGSGLRLGSLPAQYRLLLPTRQSVEAALTSQQRLYAPRPLAVPVVPRAPLTLLERIRDFATAPRGPLPAGDPLLFHDFLPEPNPIHLFDVPPRGGLDLAEELSVHVSAQGRRRDDLYVSRLPEVTLRGQIPLSRPPAPPADGDPQAFRAALRHLVFYADAQETVGDYREQSSSDPYSIRARRTQTRVGFSTFPILVASNTAVQPQIALSTSTYSGTKSSYRYSQFGVAVNHYFSDLTALGVQFLGSSTGGDSPFNFDVLDTDREADVRLQLGNRHLVAAGRIRYDLSRNGVIDYQVALAPALRGFVPIFSYNFRTRSLGLGVEIKGLTF